MLDYPPNNWSFVEDYSNPDELILQHTDGQGLPSYKARIIVSGDFYGGFGDSFLPSNSAQAATMFIQNIGSQLEDFQSYSNIANINSERLLYRK
jgi:hypothetical protein